MRLSSTILFCHEGYDLIPRNVAVRNVLPAVTLCICLHNNTEGMLETVLPLVAEWKQFYLTTKQNIFRCWAVRLDAESVPRKRLLLTVSCTIISSNANGTGDSDLSSLVLKNRKMQRITCPLCEHERTVVQRSDDREIMLDKGKFLLSEALGIAAYIHQAYTRDP